MVDFKEIFDALPSALTILSPNLQIAAMNGNRSSDSLLPADQLIGRHIEDASTYLNISPDDLPELIGALRRAAHTGQSEVLPLSDFLDLSLVSQSNPGSSRR